MTRCLEFYEKLEKDGNFCGMGEQKYRVAKEYWDNYRAPLERRAAESGETIGTDSILTEDAWKRQQRKEADRFKEIEPEKPKYPDRKVREYDFAKEVNNFIIWCYEQREEKVIREVIEKAIVNNRK